ncbi:unnamed protein product [Symbiodinium sp. CCMP2592]|nr:unnamed protein product [Symbiodinium sp. CCMP2592]
MMHPAGSKAGNHSPAATSFQTQCMLVVGLGCRHLHLPRWRQVSRLTSWGEMTRQLLTLRAAQFPDALAQELSATQAAYVGDPLFGLESTLKGRVLQQAIAETLSSLDFSTPVQEAVPGLCVNGNTRATHQSEFDFMHGERRVECKGTSLAWSAKGHWHATWTRIKLGKALFDDLLLALHSPGRVDVLRHDGMAGVATQGVRTEIHGHAVRVHGSRGLEDPSEACQEIVQKMQEAPNSCHHIGSLPTDSGVIERSLAKERAKKRNSMSSYWYKGIPLSDYSPSSRGLRLEKVACAIDRMLHPSSTFSRTLPTLEQRPGARCGCADWARDRTQVKFKSSRLSWHCTKNVWRAHFAGIKFATRSFDELWLGLYSPLGFYLFQYSGTIGRSTTGASTDVAGHDIVVYGPSHEENPLAACEVIVRKLKASGCELLATVSW